jgi:hypothetical protein
MSSGRPDAESPVSFIVSVARLPRKGMPVVVQADARQRAALARAHGLVSVQSYRADLVVEPWKRNGVHVKGTVSAVVGQECVVTLEPLENTIDEPVEGIFLPEDSKLGRLGFESGGEIMLDAEGPDSPETFGGDAIDIGAFAEEFFGLAIDPFPRKAGAALAAEREDAAPVAEWQQKLRGLAQKE